MKNFLSNSKNTQLRGAQLANSSGIQSNFNKIENNNTKAEIKKILNLDGAENFLESTGNDNFSDVEQIKPDLSAAATQKSTNKIFTTTQELSKDKAEVESKVDSRPKKESNINYLSKGFFFIAVAVCIFCWDKLLRICGLRHADGRHNLIHAVREVVGDIIHAVRELAGDIINDQGAITEHTRDFPNDTDYRNANDAAGMLKNFITASTTEHTLLNEENFVKSLDKKQKDIVLGLLKTLRNDITTDENILNIANLAKDELNKEKSLDEKIKVNIVNDFTYLSGMLQSQNLPNFRGPKNFLYDTLLKENNSHEFIMEKSRLTGVRREFLNQCFEIFEKALDEKSAQKFLENNKKTEDAPTSATNTTATKLLQNQTKIKIQ